jgi:hypothetical protein
MRPAALPLLACLAAAIVATVPACTDPVHDRAVSDLGPEKGGKNEFHRAGQPCVVCHNDEGPANTVFSVAGTIFAQPATLIGVDSVQVQLTDAAGTKYVALTNCVGNFFVKPDQWAPHFPILVRVAKAGVSRLMTSPIGREPSCAGCHNAHVPVDEPLYQVDHISIFTADEPSPPQCDVNPNLGAP